MQLADVRLLVLLTATMLPTLPGTPGKDASRGTQGYPNN